MTLVAVLADTHIPRGARTLPAACARAVEEADLAIHAGDLTGAAFLEELRALATPVHAVHGNADEPALRALLPERLVVEAGGARIGVVHDAGPRRGREERLARLFPGCDAVVYGHSHLPQVERHGALWVLNPGSPTERRRSPSRTFLLLRAGRGELRPELVDIDP